MNVLECVLDRLEQAQAAFCDCPHTNVGTDPQVLWLERQLTSIILHLQALAADVADGFSISEMGLFTDDEFHEMMEDLRVEISCLKAMIRSLKGMTRT